MKDRKSFLKGMAAGIAAAVVAGALICAGLFGFGTDAVSLSHIGKLMTIERLIEEEYLGEQDKEQMAEGMYMGLVAGLNDPYSRYYTKEQYEAVNSQIQGEYVGIGVVLEQDAEGSVTIAQCYEDSAAAEAGIQAGDVLMAVDGVTVDGKTLSEISESVKNTEEDHVVLTISREGEEEPLEITVQVRSVEITAVTWEMLEEQVGYLKISSFTHVAPEQFRNALEELEEQGMKSLIVDLRDNTGGLLDAVCEILDEILPKGLIVYTEDKYGNRTERESTGERTLDVPLTVLVNENSASASEIFAGAVQDHQVGTIVGTVTYGKGVVQTTKVFQDGSALKLTISHYYTPDGNDINGVGIQPDVEVSLSEEAQEKWAKGEELTLEEDAQLAAALEIS